MPRDTGVVSIIDDRFPALTSKMRSEVAAIVRDAIQSLEERVEESMTWPKSGRLYPRPGGRIHQASAPGEPPAVDTGKLIKSIQSEMESETIGVVYSDDVEYAPYLEYGTVRVAPRPFMAPAAEYIRPQFLDELSKLERRLR